MSPSLAPYSNECDWIHIHELCALVKIGCSEEERTFPQRLLINLDVGLDCRQAASSGDLKQTICYVTLKDSLLEFLSSRTWILLEELTEASSSYIFRTQPLAQKVKIQVRKFVTTDTAWVGISTSRHRHE